MLIVGGCSCSKIYGLWIMNSAQCATDILALVLLLQSGGIVFGWRLLALLNLDACLVF